MREQPDYRGWEQVPEETIRAAAEMADDIGPDAAPDNLSFKKVLMAGNMFKQAGLTPIYVWCEHSHRLAVYAQEINYKKLH